LLKDGFLDVHPLNCSCNETIVVVYDEVSRAIQLDKALATCGVFLSANKGFYIRLSVFVRDNIAVLTYKH